MSTIKAMENVCHVKAQNDILPSLEFAKVVLRCCNPHDQLYCSPMEGSILRARLLFASAVRAGCLQTGEAGSLCEESQSKQTYPGISVSVATLVWLCVSCSPRGLSPSQHSRAHMSSLLQTI